MARFADRIRELEEAVGDGDLQGKVNVDQVYAAVQHEGYWKTGPLAGVVIRNHPRGGGSKFLAEPLFENAADYMRRLAGRALEPAGLVSAMRENVEDLSGEVYDRAPREFDDLRDSGHPTVMDGDRLAYDRPPRRPRLSEGALREKKRRSRLGESLRPGERVRG